MPAGKMTAPVSSVMFLLFVASPALSTKETCTDTSLLARATVLSRTTDSSGLADAAAERTTVNSQEWELFQLLNQLREQGFTCGGDFVFAPNSRPLLFDCRLWRASYLHSEDMANNGYTGHVSKDGRQPWQRAEEQGIPGWEQRNNENLASGQGLAGAQAVLDGWKTSSGHCRNMMHPDVRMFGAGYAYNSESYWKNYWTEMLSWSTTGLDDSCYPDEASEPTPAPTPEPSGETPGCTSWMVAPGFGQLTGAWAGACSDDSCVFKFVAKDDDGMYIAGVQSGQYFKMVKLNAAGDNQAGTGKYYVGCAPEDNVEMVAKYHSAISAGSNYAFDKGDGFCDPSTAPAPTEITSLSDCSSWRVPLGFGRIKGAWSGNCQHTNFPDTCYFKYVAKDQDDKYIAGMQDGQYFKMVKFDAQGNSLGGVYYTGCQPEDAAAMVTQFHQGSQVGANYVFEKGDDFSCSG